MSSPEDPKLRGFLEVLSVKNSVGGTIQMVLAVAVLCAVFSTIFWWLR